MLFPLAASGRLPTPDGAQTLAVSKGEMDDVRAQLPDRVNGLLLSELGSYLDPLGEGGGNQAAQSAAA